jgi:hypothetical protein
LSRLSYTIDLGLIRIDVSFDDESTATVPFRYPLFLELL